VIKAKNIPGIKPSDKALIEMLSSYEISIQLEKKLFAQGRSLFSFDYILFHLKLLLLTIPA